MRIRGPIAFDYSNDDGIYRIGTGASLFEIKFSSARDDCIRILRDPASIDAVALAGGAIESTHVKDAARFDYSSRDRIPKEGQVAILRNAHGLYAALKIRDVKNAFHGDAFNEVTFEYLILDDGSRDFSDVADIEAVDASFSKRVLLTGAGFSRNWGGLLATEVSGRILAHHAVMARPRVRDLILREPSFEDALETTRTGFYEAADAQAMELAIKAVFDDMDAAYKNPNPPV